MSTWKVTAGISYNIEGYGSVNRQSLQCGNDFKDYFGRVTISVIKQM